MFRKFCISHRKSNKKCRHTIVTERSCSGSQLKQAVNETKAEGEVIYIWYKIQIVNCGIRMRWSNNSHQQLSLTRQVCSMDLREYDIQDPLHYFITITLIICLLNFTLINVSLPKAPAIHIQPFLLDLIFPNLSLKIFPIILSLFGFTKDRSSAMRNIC